MRSAVLALVVSATLFAVVILGGIPYYYANANTHHKPTVFHLKAHQTRKLTTSIGADGKPGPSIPLQGNLTYWAEFFTTVTIGNPAQYFDLQVDTGSTDIIVYGDKCKTCPNNTARYYPGKSKDFHQIACHDMTFYCDKTLCMGEDPCAFEDDFGGGNHIAGTVGWDAFNPDPKGSKNARVSLGAINKVAPVNLSFEPAPIDGLWGLAHKPLSGWYGEPAIGIWINENGYYDSFSMCFYNDSGILEIGSNYYTNNFTDFNWTEVQQVDGGLTAWYVVWMDQWRFGNTSLGISADELNENNVIVDSGTTLIVVPKFVYQAIAKVLLGMCSTNNMPGICGNPPNGSQLFAGDCIQMTPAQLAVFPNLTISLYEIHPLTIYPIDYLWQGAGIPGWYCLGIQPMGNSFPIILGDVFMQKFHVVFDRNEALVGFGNKTTCPK